MPSPLLYLIRRTQAERYTRLSDAQQITSQAGNGCTHFRALCASLGGSPRRDTDHSAFHVGHDSPGSSDRLTFPLLELPRLIFAAAPLRRNGLSRPWRGVHRFARRQTEATRVRVERGLSRERNTATEHGFIYKHAPSTVDHVGDSHLVPFHRTTVFSRALVCDDLCPRSSGIRRQRWWRRGSMGSVCACSPYRW